MSILTNVFYGTHNPMDQFGNNTTPEYEKLFKELSVLQSQLREMGVVYQYHAGQESLLGHINT